MNLIRRENSEMPSHNDIYLGDLSIADNRNQDDIAVGYPVYVECKSHGHMLQGYLSA